MNRKKIIIILIIFSIIFSTVIVYKIKNNGNNISNKSVDDLIEYIFNMRSYEAQINVTVNSNKTTNKYELRQYYLEPNFSKQIVLQPEKLRNLEIIYDGKSLKVNNTNLGLSKVYGSYDYLNNNLLWLNYIVNILKESYKFEENEESIVLRGAEKQYGYKILLYIKKQTGLPEKVEVIDDNNNCKIYIEYTEIKLNNIQENNIFK